MKNSITVHLNYTADDYVRAVRYIRSRSLLVKYAFLIPLIIFLLICLMAYYLNPPQFIETFSKPQNLFILLLPIFASPIIYFLNKRNTNFLLRYQVKKQIASSPVMQQPQTITFDQDGIEGSTMLGSANTHWEALIEITESETDLYFFMAKKIAMFVPKSAFNSTEDESDLRSFIIQKVGPKARMNIQD